MVCLGPFYSVVILPSGKQLTFREKETKQERDWEGHENYPMCIELLS